MAKSWDDINPQTGGDRDKFKLEDFFKVVDTKRLDQKSSKDKKYYAFRFDGGLVSFEQAWVPLFKDGKPVIASKGPTAGKAIEVPKMILSYDSETESYDGNIQDPYLDLIHRMNEVIGDEKDEHGNSKRVRIQRYYLSNCLHRLMQQPPRDIIYPTDEEANSGFMAAGSETWTPWQVFRMPPGLTDRIKNLKQLNKYTIQGVERTFSVADPKAGRDINIKFDSGQSGQGMWDAQIGSERKPLTPDENQALRWNLDLVTEYIRGIDLNAAAKDADQLSRGFFAGSGSGSGGRRSQRTLMDNDLPEDLSNTAGGGNRRGRQQAAASQQSDFGSDDFGSSDFGAGGGDDFGGGGDDFGSSDDFGGNNDFGGGGGDDFGTGNDFGAGDDFGGGGDFGSSDDFGAGGGDDFGGGNDFGSDDFGGGNDFDAPQPQQRAPQNRGQQQRSPQGQPQNRGRQQAVVDTGELDGLDDTGDEFSNSESDFGSDDFDAPQQQPVRRGPAPQQQRAPQQNRGQPQQRPQQQRPQQGGQPQNRGPAPQQQRPQGGQPMNRPQGNPQQNRGPAPQQQRPQQRPPQGGQPQNRGPAPQQRPPQGGQRPPQGRR